MTTALARIALAFALTALAAPMLRAEAPADAGDAAEQQQTTEVAEVEAQPASGAATAACDAPEIVDDPNRGKVIATLEGERRRWFDRIATLAHQKMAGAGVARYREAEHELLEINDPDALEPMALVMYTPDQRFRSTFVKAARQYAQSDFERPSRIATMYLSDIAVFDPSAVLRGRARSALLAPETPRRPERLRQLVTDAGEPDARDRAAGLLADIEDAAMLEAMVDLLVTDEWKLVAKVVEAHKVTMDIRAKAVHPPDMSNTTTVQAVSPQAVAQATIVLPRVRATEIQTTISAPAHANIEYEWEKVSTKHPGMLTALRRLTGRDFGYNEDAWHAWIRKWRREHPDAPSASADPYGIQWE